MESDLENHLLYSTLLEFALPETRKLFLQVSNIAPPATQATFELAMYDLLRDHLREVLETPSNGDDRQIQPSSVAVAAASVSDTSAAAAAASVDDDDYDDDADTSSASAGAGSPRDGCLKWATYIVISVLLGSLLTVALGDLRLRVQMVVVFAVFFIYLGCPEWVVTGLYAFIILGGCLFAISLSIFSLVTTLLGYLDLLVGSIHLVLGYLLDLLVGYLPLLLGYLRLVVHILVISMIIFIHLWAHET